MARGTMIFWAALALVVLVLAYIRLAPSDPARWHRDPQVTGDVDLPHGVKRRVKAGPDGLARLDAIIRAAPRTRVVAGSIADGMVTYVSRTKVMGFPDYTTVQQEGEVLNIYARLRFGRSDLGVNKARVEGWLDALQAGG